MSKEPEVRLILQCENCLMRLMETLKSEKCSFHCVNPLPKGHTASLALCQAGRCLLSMLAPALSKQRRARSATHLERKPLGLSGDFAGHGLLTHDA